MKSHRFKKGYRRTASKLHKTVGDILMDPQGMFAGHRVYQEYPVARVNPDCKNQRLHFDWVDLDLKLVIECHGLQHYEVVTFGGEASDLTMQVVRDGEKEEYALKAGFTYIIVPYWDQFTITEERIWDLYRKNFNPIVQEKAVAKPESTYEKEQKERARVYRQEQYQRKKAWALKIKEMQNANK